MKINTDFVDKTLESQLIFPEIHDKRFVNFRVPIFSSFVLLINFLVNQFNFNEQEDEKVQGL